MIMLFSAARRVNGYDPDKILLVKIVDLVLAERDILSIPYSKKPPCCPSS
jgi:hypothetical protein